MCAAWPPGGIFQEVSRAALPPPPPPPPLLLNRCVRAGRHRDGFSAPELDAYYGFGDNPFTTDPFCQMRNTNTLIFTMGDQAMEMPLSFPLDKCDAGNTREYRTHPLLTIPLLNGTLLIYAPLG